MRRARNRLSQSTMAEELYAVFAVAAVIALVALIWTAVHLGASIDHLAAPANNPVVLVLDLLRKKTPWPLAATFVVAAEACQPQPPWRLAVVWVVAHHRGRREVVDVLARRLPRNAKALRRYSNPEHAPVAADVGPGLALGCDVVSGAVIRQSWEDVAAIIAGARTGKTTTQVAPAILAAPGRRLHLFEQARRGGSDGGSTNKGRVDSVDLRPPRHRGEATDLVVEPPRHGHQPGRRT